jgi:hypothetical protein
MKLTKEEKIKQGKDNRKKGTKFELLVRKDLESKGWNVSKYMNQVEFYHNTENIIKEIKEPFSGFKVGRLIPAKRKYNPFTKRPMAEGTGFPDFIAIKKDFFKIDADSVPTFKEELEEIFNGIIFDKVERSVVIGVEAKSNGILDKVEKEKCKWLLENNIFSKILIAYKDYPEENINLPSNKRKKMQVCYKEFNKDL